MVRVGFFEKREKTFWIPFIFRDGLDLVQGAETGADGM